VTGKQAEQPAKQGILCALTGNFILLTDGKANYVDPQPAVACMVKAGCKNPGRNFTGNIGPGNHGNRKAQRSMVFLRAFLFPWFK
jgi:hypothetical protein